LSRPTFPGIDAAFLEEIFVSVHSGKPKPLNVHEQWSNTLGSLVIALPANGVTAVNTRQQEASQIVVPLARQLNRLRKN
jgi:hypothetical protein